MLACLHKIKIYRNLTVLFTLFLVFLNIRSIKASQRADEPRIGLVLSGGGARTGAQIGVLKVLEELRIPVRFISATSTGSLIGALYVSGMSPLEIEEALLAIDWDDVLMNKLSRRHLFFRRKQDDLNYLVKYQFALEGFNISLPKSLVNPHRLNLKIKNLLWPVNGSCKFDDLPIPFRAVAADLETGKEVVLSEGDLSKVVLASLSVPGVLAPVKIGDRWLVDGGIVNNIPIDTVKRMGAEIIIVVNVTTPLKDINGMKNLLSTTQQVITMQTHGNGQEALKLLNEKDIEINPELKGITTYNFSKFADSISRGEDAARELAERLKNYSLSEDNWDRYLSRREKLRRVMPRIDFVRINNETKLSNRVIRKLFRLKKGSVLNLKSLEQDISKLSHLDAFDTIDYKTIEEKGEKGLLIIARRKPAGNDFIRFGLNFKTSTKGGTRFNFASNYTMTQINALNAEWRNELKLGDRHELRTEFYQPLNRNLSYFISPFASITNRSTDYYINGLIKDDKRLNNATIGFSLGRMLGRWGEIKVGILRGWGLLKTRVGAATQDSQASGGGAYFAKMTVDTIDDANFPHKGILSFISWTHSADHLGSRFDANTLEMKFLASKSWGYNTFSLTFDGGTTLNADLLLYDNFTLGGFLNLSGLREAGLSGQHKILGKAIYYLKVSGFSKGLLTFPVYVGGSIESGNVWIDADQINWDSMIWAGSIFLGVDSILGPVYLGFGLSEGWNQAIHLVLGRAF